MNHAENDPTEIKIVFQGCEDDFSSTDAGWRSKIRLPGYIIIRGEESEDDGQVKAIYLSNCRVKFEVKGHLFW